MNDNILTEHPKPTVEQCLRLETLGMGMDPHKGDWYYSLISMNWAGPYLLGPHLVADAKEDFPRIKIPTLPQLLDFVREQAEKVFERNDFDGIDLSACASYLIRETPSESYVASCMGNGWTDVICFARALTPELALIALLDEIEKHRKVNDA